MVDKTSYGILSFGTIVVAWAALIKEIFQAVAFFFAKEAISILSDFKSAVITGILSSSLTATLPVKTLPATDTLLMIASMFLRSPFAETSADSL